MLNNLNRFFKYLASPSPRLPPIMPDLEKGITEKTPQEFSTLLCLEQLNDVRPLHAAILGRRASGKSSITKNIIQCHLQKSDTACALIFHGTEKLHPVYGNDSMLPSSKVTVHDTYDYNVLETYIKEKQRYNISPEQIMIVFDNSFEMGSGKCSKLETILSANINSIISADHPLGIPLHIREKTNHIFLFKEHVYIYRKRTFDLWNLQDIFYCTDIFHSMYKTATDAQYGYLLVDLNKKTCYIGRSLKEVQDIPDSEL